MKNMKNKRISKLPAKRSRRTSSRRRRSRKISGGLFDEEILNLSSNQIIYVIKYSRTDERGIVQRIKNIFARENLNHTQIKEKVNTSNGNIDLFTPEILPLHFAVKKCYPIVVEYLVQFADPNIRNEQNNTAIQELRSCAGSAFDMRHLRMLKALVRSGAKVNVSNKYGKTPLMIQAGFGNYSCVEFLLKNKANYRKTDIYGRRASFYAKDKKLRDLLVFHEEQISSSFVQRTLMTRKRKSGETTYVPEDIAFLISQNLSGKKTKRVKF